MKIKLKAGRYWVGDLRYIMPQETHNKVFPLWCDNKYEEIFEKYGFVHVKTFDGDCTAWFYKKDRKIDEIGVDSASFGLVLKENTKEWKTQDFYLGRFVNLPDCELRYENGDLFFGDYSLLSGFDEQRVIKEFVFYHSQYGDTIEDHIEKMHYDDEDGGARAKELLEKEFPLLKL